jgi:hypothetical protein
MLTLSSCSENAKIIIANNNSIYNIVSLKNIKCINKEISNNTVVCDLSNNAIYKIFPYQVTTL